MKVYTQVLSTCECIYTSVRIALRIECESGGGRGRGGETVGAVDLGGSSLEVSFVPDEPFPPLESQGPPASYSLARINRCQLCKGVSAT